MCSSDLAPFGSIPYSVRHRFQDFATWGATDVRCSPRTARMMRDACLTTIEESPMGRDIDAAGQDVQSAINAARGTLPNNLPYPPVYNKVNPADAPILIYSVQSDTLPLTQVDDYAENVVVQQLSQIDGVGQVNLGGQQKPAVRVQVDPAKLVPLGVDLTDISAAITTASVNEPKGSLNGATRNLAIYDNDQLTTAAPWNDVIVKYNNGAPVRIRDVGKAVDGAENMAPVRSYAGRSG